MNKWDRRVRLAVTEAGAKVVERKRSGNGHARLIVRLPSGAEHKIVVSSSPANEDNALRAIQRDVLQLINPTAPKGTP